MKILLFLPKAFEHMETGVFIDVMGWAREDFGCDVRVETGGYRREVASTFGVPIVVDRLIDEIRAEDYDALALPGGFETHGYFEEAFDERFLQLIRDFDAGGKIIATVCVAALALGKSGILKGRSATTYHLGGGRRLRQLAGFGVDVRYASVVVDNNVITSWCPETAVRVAFILLEMLTSKEKADEVRAAMGYAIYSQYSSGGDSADLNLPTDEDTNVYFEHVVKVLCDIFKYSHGAAVALTREYYRLFTDKAYCDSIGIPMQDDDFFFHEAAYGMALRIHYYLTLKQDPNPMKYIDFRTEYQKDRWREML